MENVLLSQLPPDKRRNGKTERESRDAFGSQTIFLSIERRLQALRPCFTAGLPLSVQSCFEITKQTCQEGPASIY